MREGTEHAGGAAHNLLHHLVLDKILEMKATVQLQVLAMAQPSRVTCPDGINEATRKISGSAEYL